MSSKSRLFVILSTGFALFSMFFGSGNLVFPLQIGRESGGYLLSAALGLFLTGVLVPAFGTFTIVVFEGSSRDFFQAMGCRAEKWFPLLALSLMGPFGVLARCLTVAQGSFDAVFPGLSPMLFTLGACVVIFILSVGQRRIVTFIGAVLSPLLLLSLVSIVFQGMREAPLLGDEMYQFNYESFKQGFLQGYQLMDLLAAFFFSAFVIRCIEKEASAVGSCRFSLFAWAALTGMGLLGMVYATLVVLGGAYHTVLEGVNPEQLLGAIATEVLGPEAGLVVCLCVILTCLTTGIVLAKLFADYLQKELFQEKLGAHVAMFLTLLVAFSVSQLEFSGIAAFIGPALVLLYPALMVMALHLVLVKWGMMRRQPWLFPTVSLLSICLQWGGL